MKVESGFVSVAPSWKIPSRNEMEVVQHLSGWLPKEGPKALAPVSNKVSWLRKRDTPSDEVQKITEREPNSY